MLAIGATIVKNEGEGAPLVGRMKSWWVKVVLLLIWKTSCTSPLSNSMCRFPLSVLLKPGHVGYRVSCPFY